MPVNLSFTVLTETWPDTKPEKRGTNMLREEALGILHLPENATKDQIEENYKKHCDLYYPPRYARNPVRDTDSIKEQLYKNISKNYYRQRDIPIISHIPDFVAYMRYVDVQEAYKYLTDPKNQNKHGVDPRTPYGYDVLHYGKMIAFVRNKICKWVGALALIEMMLVFILVITGMDNVIPDIWKIMEKCYYGMLGFLWLCSPLDTLLYIPKRFINGIRYGASIGPMITKPITIVLMAGLYTIGGSIALFIFPCLIYGDREERYNPVIKGEKKGRAAAQALFLQTEELIEAQRQQISSVLDRDDPLYRQIMEEEWEKLSEYNKELAETETSCERKLAKAEKRRDRIERTAGWGATNTFEIEYEIDSDMRWAEEQYETAQKECDEELSEKKFAVMRQELICDALYAQLH